MLLTVVFSRQCRRGPRRPRPIQASNHVSKPKRSYQHFQQDLDKIAPEFIYEQDQRPSDTLEKEQSDSSDSTVHVVLPSKSNSMDIVQNLSYPTTENIGDIVNKYTDCCICLERFSIGDRLRIVPCRHCFHSCCIMLWLNRCNLCPLCKTDVWKSLNIETHV